MSLQRCGGGISRLYKLKKGLFRPRVADFRLPTPGRLKCTTLEAEQATLTCSSKPITTEPGCQGVFEEQFGCHGRDPISLPSSVDLLLLQFLCQKTRRYSLCCCTRLIFRRTGEDRHA